MEDMGLIFSRTITSKKNEYIVEVFRSKTKDESSCIYNTVFSCKGKNMMVFETYESDTLNEAKIDYNTISDTIKHVLKCEGLYNV